MDIEFFTSFFMWLTILNGSVLVLWTVVFLIAPDLVYKTQNKWFPIPREKFNVIFYAFLGFFKILFLFFNVAPYVTLLILNSV